MSVQKVRTTALLVLPDVVNEGGYLCLQQEDGDVWARTPGATEADRRRASLLAASPALLAVAKQCASECAECDQKGVYGYMNVNRGGRLVREEKRCDSCAFIWDAINHAEGRS